MNNKKKERSTSTEPQYRARLQLTKKKKINIKKTYAKHTLAIAIAHKYYIAKIIKKNKKKIQLKCNCTYTQNYAAKNKKSFFFFTFYNKRKIR